MEQTKLSLLYSFVVIDMDLDYVMCLVLHLGHNIDNIVRKYGKKGCNESRMAAAQFLLDSIEIRDNLGTLFHCYLLMRSVK